MVNIATLPFEIAFNPFNKGSSCQRISYTAMKNLSLPCVKSRLRINAQDQGAQLPADTGSSSSSSSKEENKDNYAKRALERAKAYKIKDQNMSKTKGAEEALQRAKAYKKQQNDDKDNTVEVEIITRDGIITRKVTRPDQAFSNVKDYRSSGISSMDFVGLGFSEKKKKKREFTGGLESLPSGPLPEIQIITGDATKLGAQTPASNNSNNNDNNSEGSALYKPKVATWGVFPRPENISKAYGGGKVIRPGESLETEEEKATREAQTKKLLDDYKEKMGLNVDPKLKAECEKVLKEGDSLMEMGELRAALGCYEKIMKEMVFQSELHGLAALQWSVCLDSLSRSNEARVMYEKLGSHPNHFVRKKAKQFIFGFQAMEKLKVPSSYTLNTTSYENYFEVFDDGYNTAYYPTVEEKMNDEILGQALPYVIFLLFPIILVLTIIVSKTL